MVNLREKPYYLNDEQIKWVEDTIASMTIEEKIGQLFVNMVTDRSPEALREVINTYHPGAIRYQNAPAPVLYAQNKVLQEASRIPLLIASNTEAGGNGAVSGGTPVAYGAAIAATGDPENAYIAGQISAKEAAAIGCNWSYCPVVDLKKNWRNTIIQLRAFSDDPDETIACAKAYLRGTKTEVCATCIKHFPGDGTEENDQHLMMGINDCSCEEWDATYGKVYKTLIDEGVMTIMAGHIALPAYSRALRPGIADKDIRPATLAPEIITGLLKGKLGFNGLVVTDASHMIGIFGASVPRRELVPGAIAAGCDMFLFFYNRDEDFKYMMDGYKNGTITEERLSDALHRILGIKAALNLHILKAEGKLMKPESALADVGCEAHHKAAGELAEKYITLVKDRENYLPLTVEKYPRLKLVFIGGEGRVVAGQLIKGDDDIVKANIVKQFEAAGFQVDADDITGRQKMEEFKKRYDAVILILSVAGFAQYNVMRVKWDLPTKQPWYMSELPTFVISVTFPNMLIDVPMARCYINTYMNHPEAIAALVNKLTGKTPFTGKYKDSVFCGRWDTRI